MKTSAALSSASLAIVALTAYGIATAQEARLGRLFYTPEERQKINEKRGVITTTNSTPQTVIVNGMVVRSGQAPILFIDGKESVGDLTGATAARQLAQGVPFKTEDGKTIAGKPGQIVDLANGRAMESYQLVPGIAPIPPADYSPTKDAASTQAPQSNVPRQRPGDMPQSRAP